MTMKESIKSKVELISTVADIIEFSVLIFLHIANLYLLIVILPNKSVEGSLSADILELISYVYEQIRLDGFTAYTRATDLMVSMMFISIVALITMITLCYKRSLDLAILYGRHLVVAVLMPIISYLGLTSLSLILTSFYSYHFYRLIVEKRMISE